MLNVEMKCRSHLWNIARTHWSRSMEMTHKLLRASDVWLTVIISSTKWVDVTFVTRFVLTFVTLSVHLAEDVTACKVGGRFGAWQQFWPNALADATNEQCYVRSHQPNALADATNDQCYVRSHQLMPLMTSAMLGPTSIHNCRTVNGHKLVTNYFAPAYTLSKLL